LRPFVVIRAAGKPYWLQEMIPLIRQPAKKIEKYKKSCMPKIPAMTS
jgi:hypothetical protein